MTQKAKEITKEQQQEGSVAKGHRLLGKPSYICAIFQTRVSSKLVYSSIRLKRQSLISI